MCHWMYVKVRGQRLGDISLLPPCGPGNRIQVVNLGPRHLYLLNHFTSHNKRLVNGQQLTINSELNKMSLEYFWPSHSSVCLNLALGSEHTACTLCATPSVTPNRTKGHNGDTFAPDQRLQYVVSYIVFIAHAKFSALREPQQFNCGN